MLTAIEADARTGTSSPALQAVDSWALGQQFNDVIDPGPGGGTGTVVSSVLALTWLARTGEDASMAAGTVALPAEMFTSEMIDSQVPGAAYPPLQRPRLETIATEAGAAISVGYATASCVQGTAGTPPQEASNTSACFPAYWSGTGATPDWFNKSLVTAVTTSDLTGAGTPNQVVSYAYLGGAAWRLDENPLTLTPFRTWNEFRGYAQVKVTTGTAPDPVSQTVETYMRGMDGDPATASGGSPSSRTVSYPSAGPAAARAAVTDSDWLAGQVLETDTYTQSGGTVDKAVVGSWPTSYAQTASQSQPGSLPPLTAHMPTSEASDTMLLRADGTWSDNTTATYYNGDDLTVTSDTSATGVTETCTSTAYATPPSGNAMMKSYPKQVTTVTGAASAGACPAAASGTIVSDARYYYDQPNATLTTLGTLGSLASPGGLETGVQQALTWASGGSEAWQAMSAISYDSIGRVTSSINANGKVTGTQYAPAYTAHATMALPQTVTVTNPKGWHTTTTYDQERGLATQVSDVNQQVITEAYDQLGRLTSVTLPMDHGQAATYQFAYSITGTAPPAVTTKTLLETGGYATSTAIYDGMLHELQTQSPTVSHQAGRVNTNLYYNSLGQVTESDAAYFDNSAPPGISLFQPSLGALTDRTLTAYDGQGRVTAAKTYDGNTLVAQTVTAYPGMNEADVTPPAGGTATSAFTNALGLVTASWAYNDRTTPNGNPADATITGYTYTPSGKQATIADAKGNTWTYSYDLLGRKTASTDPGTKGTSGPSGNEGKTTYAYDPDGNLLTTTDPQGQQLTWTYDELDRKLAEFSGTTAGTQIAAWGYDTASLAGQSGSSPVADGQLAEADSFVGGSKYAETVAGYNAAYQPTGQTTSIPATGGAPAATFTTSSAFGPLTGQLDSTTYGNDGGLGQETVSYGYNLADALTGFGASTSFYLDSTTYDPIGHVLSATFGAPGAELFQEYTPDQTFPSRLLASSTNLQTDTTGPADMRSWTYDQAGNVTSTMDQQDPGAAAAATQLQCFANDHLGQLTSAWTDNGTQSPAPPTLNGTSTPNPGGVGSCVSTAASATAIGGPAPYWRDYAYDPLGSRTTQTAHNTSSVANDTPANATTQSQSYPGSNGASAAATPAAVTSVSTSAPGGTVTITPAYDSDGRTTSRSETTISPLTSGVTTSAGGALCLDDASSSTTAGNHINIHACNGTNAEKVTATPVTGGSELQVLGNCVDVSGNGTASGTVIVLEPCSASTLGEIWKASSSGTWVNPNSGLCLTDPGSSTTNGTQLDITACSTSASQKWTTAGGTSRPLPGTTQQITYTPQGMLKQVTSPNGTGTDVAAYTYDTDGTLLVRQDPGKVVYYADGGAEEVTYNTSGAVTSATRFYGQSPDGTAVVRSLPAGGTATVSFESGDPQRTGTESVTATTA
jgi:YD repeat-containing protein